MTGKFRWQRRDCKISSNPIQFTLGFSLISSITFFTIFSTVKGYGYPDQPQSNHYQPQEQYSYNSYSAPPPAPGYGYTGQYEPPQNNNYQPPEQYSYNSYSAPPPSPPPQYELYTAVTYQELNVSYHCGVIPDTNFELYRSSNDDYAVADVTPYGKFPWIVLILKYNKVVCQGVLIHHNFILTSARCIPEYKSLEDYEIRFGDWDILTDYNEYEAYHDREARICTRRAITNYASKGGGYSYSYGGSGGSEYSSYQKYSGDDSSDLILLKSDFEPCDKFPHARPICLPKTYQSPTYYATGQDQYAPYAVCWVAGWYGSEITRLKNHPQPEKTLEYNSYNGYSSYAKGGSSYNQKYYKGYENSMIQKRAKVKQVNCPSSYSANNYGSSSDICFIGVDGYDACVAEQGAAVFCVVREEQSYGEYYSGYNNQDAYSQTAYSHSDSYDIPVVSSLHPEYVQYSKPPIKAAPSPSKPYRYRAVLYAIVQKPAKCRVGYDSYGYGYSRKSKPLVATRVDYQVVSGIMDQFWTHGYDQSCPLSKAYYNAPPQKSSYKNQYYFGSYYNAPMSNNYGYKRPSNKAY